MNPAKTFILVIVLVMLYDVAIAVATFESAAASGAGNRKLLLANIFAPPRPVFPTGAVGGVVTNLVNNVGGAVNGAVDWVGQNAAEMAAPAIALCF
jgi:hypothetical protein